LSSKPEEYKEDDTYSLTEEQKRRVRKVLFETKTNLEKMTIEAIDRGFTQTAVKGVVAVIEEAQKKAAKRVLLKTKAELQKNTLRAIDRNITQTASSFFVAVEGKPKSRIKANRKKRSSGNKEN
jgi:hypothetical protein